MSKENCSNKMQESVKLFREKYPEGKISVNVSQSNGCVMARARIYPKYNEEERCYLSEITIAKAMNDSNSFETLISETQCEAVSLAIQTACSFGGNQSVVVTDTSQKEEIVETIPQRRFVEPSEIAGMVKYLVSKEAKGVTGQSINLCAGLSVGY